jgi:hypothetical protein
VRVARYVVIVAALAAAGMAAVHFRARTTRIGYGMARERAEGRRLLEEQAELRFQLGRLKAPGRMMEQGKQLHLLLVPPATVAPPPSAANSHPRAGGPQSASGARRPSRQRPQ